MEFLDSIINMPLDLIIANIGCTVFGLLGVFLGNLRESSPSRKYAPICGLLGEPFWFYIAWVTVQPGVMLLAFIYGCGWWSGIKNFWLKKE